MVKGLPMLARLAPALASGSKGIHFGSPFGKGGDVVTETMDTTTEIFEVAVKLQPDRYIVTRDEEGNLFEVIDRDTGTIHQKHPNGWFWVV